MASLSCIPPLCPSGHPRRRLKQGDLRWMIQRLPGPVQPSAVSSHSVRTEFQSPAFSHPQSCQHLVISHPLLSQKPPLLLFPPPKRDLNRGRANVLAGSPFPNTWLDGSHGSYIRVTSKGHTPVDWMCVHTMARRLGHHLPRQPVLLRVAGPGSCEVKTVKRAGSRRAGRQIGGGGAECC